jgi:hypothetical protein
MDDTETMVARLNWVAITFFLSVRRPFDLAPFQGANAEGVVPGVETPGPKEFGHLRELASYAAG